jgi:hypothetical protein
VWVGHKPRFAHDPKFPEEAAAHRKRLERTCLSHLNVFINHFGRASKTRPRSGEVESVEPLIDGSRLLAQLPYFVDAICAWADGSKEVVEEAAALSENEEVVVVESEDDPDSEWESEEEEGGRESDDVWSECSDDDRDDGAQPQGRQHDRVAAR